MEFCKVNKDWPQNFFAHVNRNKRLTARILQLRHPNGSLINSDQEMAALLKTTFLGFFREDEGSKPVLQQRTQTYMAGPLITELEARRVLDGLNPHKGASPDRLFPKVLKALNAHTAPVLARMFNISLQTLSSTLPKVSTFPLGILPILLHTPLRPTPHLTHSPFKRSALSVI